ncbi:hypothetical protein BMJ26_24935 [Sinorhizobium medicae]|nr:hypothetical protein BMJ31_21365 [Sinorhizobium medicae]PLU32985.1 hypothetical protein BMJ26_24935 [Sinorhizobium medicae]PLU37116.1 hypothetical protein BMJ28_14015 [Sinorhizobium medicae]PLU74261.1 hypothetical protein BMJ20_00505 [Sinorhizobium medicae]
MQRLPNTVGPLSSLTSYDPLWSATTVNPSGHRMNGNRSLSKAAHRPNDLTASAQKDGHRCQGQWFLPSRTAKGRGAL